MMSKEAEALCLMSQAANDEIEEHIKKMGSLGKVLFYFEMNSETFKKLVDKNFAGTSACMISGSKYQEYLQGRPIAGIFNFRLSFWKVFCGYSVYIVVDNTVKKEKAILKKAFEK